ncbi:MAG: pyridoxamine 5'-phosphate oxidase family protein [Acidimicrobiales bacterium]|nr:pyridoxamine 5'-phosphate oxidase family protein [Acidimicrobiales bacterium]
MDTTETTIDPYSGMLVLGTDECWQLFRSAEVGRLAVSISNHPDIFPLNYVVDGESIVFRTAPGTKLAAAVLGTAVAFETDGYDPEAGDAWSVVLKGHAEQIEGWLDKDRAERLPLFPWNAAPKFEFVRIVPDELTGRRFHVTDHGAWPLAGTETADDPI